MKTIEEIRTIVERAKTMAHRYPHTGYQVEIDRRDLIDACESLLSRYAPPPEPSPEAEPRPDKESKP